MKLDLIPFMPLWQALRHFSLTFSIVFASTVLGVSVVRLLRKLLHELSIPWLFLWIIPAVLIGIIAKREDKWIPNAVLRRKLAFGVAFGALILSAASEKIRREIDSIKPREAPEQSQPMANEIETPPPDPKDSPPSSRDFRPGPRGK